ncbi:4961_t:CDS:2 [Funneliformis caledonium]|uniref:4961_t:CDS:1 n=1 Tax=Funneliformis caledonium TaxID=1117310 RepID=A0A9N9GWH3_9GLOM|nr:4961_t:CDS:2 [Funneliformis caledonium]
MPSQNSEQDNDKETKTFIENYIKDVNSYLGDFLKTSQPKYDPNETSITDPLPKSSTTVKNQEKTTKSISLSELLSSPTINPEIFSNKPFKDDNASESPINDNSFSRQQEAKQSLAQKLKISEMRTDYFDQKKEIWNGALINCSELHVKLQECMSFGGFFDKMSLCTSARRKFWSCLEDQKQYLIDNGYASPGKNVAENEEILYQADLYNLSKLTQEERTEKEKLKS